MKRATDLRERMDEPDCDPRRLRNTYAQFALVNRLVAAWGRIFRRHLRPHLQQDCRLLDVGCGGGDLVRRLARWSERSGVRLDITALDTDPRALAFARAQPQPAGIEYLQASVEELAQSGRSFDIVVSNHLLHHLDEAMLPEFLYMTGSLAGALALHNDLRRHPAALPAFAVTRPIFRNSFIVEDGLRSIRRAFTPAELRELLPEGWRLERMEPFRNVVILER